MSIDLIIKQIDNELTENNVLKTDNKELSISESTYNNLQKARNEINEELLFKDNNYEEIYAIHGERDIKRCFISFKGLNLSKKNFDKVIKYSFNSLNMETIFIDVDQNNKKIIKQLEDMGFENLGIVDGKLTFLKEKEEKELGSIIDGYNKKH